MDQAGIGGQIVFLRLPEWGKVKTRLAATMGHDAALTIYKHLATLTLETVSKSGIPIYLFYEGGLPDEKNRNDAVTYHLQAKGDLGFKIQNALSYVLDRHAKAVVIGSDCPELSHEMISESLIRLNDSDVVIGPTTDGGYYLLGCKRTEPSLFTGISWGTTQVFHQTIERLNHQGLSYHILPMLSDIDTEEDWNQYVREKRQ